MEPIRSVAYCSHCGNRVTQRLIHVQRFLCRGFQADGTREEYDYPSVYYVAACETCDEILLYLDDFDEFGENLFAKASLVWPEPRTLHHSIPDHVRSCYEEADRIRHTAPNAFAGQIRRALEAICVDRGIKKGNLQKRLEELANRGEIPPILAEMAHVLRDQGNIGVHVKDNSVKPDHVHTIEDFFRVIVEYVYVAPSKLKEFRNQLSP